MKYCGSTQFRENYINNYGVFWNNKFYLKIFYETFFAYVITRLILVDGENIDSGNSSSLMLTIINCWDKFSCWKDLIYSERDLIVGRKDLKIGGIGLNNWWERTNFA